MGGLISKTLVLTRKFSHPLWPRSSQASRLGIGPGWQVLGSHGLRVESCADGFSGQPRKEGCYIVSAKDEAD